MVRLQGLRAMRAVPAMATRVGAVRGLAAAGGVADRFLKSRLQANEAWRQEKVSERSDYFSRFQGHHAPKYLWIGCSDARVPGDVLLGEDTGEVFVHRNIANQVVASDSNAMSVLQYAVDYLKVPHIIVCGHYDCGGVRAACTSHDHGAPLQQWLRGIRDTRRLYKAELEAVTDPEEQHRRLVEVNVVEQCAELLQTGVVQRRRAEAAAEGVEIAPRIHPMVYDPASGQLTRVKVAFPDKLEEAIRADIFDLGHGDEPLASSEIFQELLGEPSSPTASK